MVSGMTRAVSAVERTASALQRERHARGLSREALGALAGLSPRTIYAIEVDGVRPQRATVRVLAIALGVDPATLRDNEKRPAGEPGASTSSAGGAASGARPA
jgi:transcriptional regulator with XRE-family HTH domain